MGLGLGLGELEMSDIFDIDDDTHDPEIELGNFEVKTKGISSIEMQVEIILTCENCKQNK